MKIIKAKFSTRYKEDGYPQSEDYKKVKDDAGYSEVSFKVRGDALVSLLTLLQHCEVIGGYGHSFGIEIDPNNSEYKRTVGFDGDGSDDIKDIKLDGKEVTRNFID